MIGIHTENIFLEMKSSIEKLKEKIISKNFFINKIEKKSNIKNDLIQYYKVINTFPLKSTKWTFSKFSTYTNDYSTECPNLSEEKIDEENYIPIDSNSKSLEITNNIYQLNEKINYSKLTNLIKVDFELEGNSKFWLFLHCEEKYNNKTGVISISRCGYNRSFISLGTFVEKSNDNIIKSYNNNINTLSENKEYEFIEFRKQELVEENTVKEKSEKYKKLISEKKIDDIIDIFDKKSNYNLTVNDDGDKIICQIRLNNGENNNEIIGDFFFPVFENFNENNNNELENVINLNVKEKDNSISNSGYTIKIAGSGEKCTVFNFFNELNLKSRKYEIHNRQADCQCCKIM